MIAVRRATMEDLDALVALNADVHRLHAEAEPAYFEEATPEAVRGALESWLTQEDARVFVAQTDGAQVGYLVLLLLRRPATAFTRERHFAYVDQIAVSSGHRREGVGRALWSAALDFARSAGISRIEAQVWSFNAAARSFFTSLGFVPRMETLTFRAGEEN